MEQAYTSAQTCALQWCFQRLVKGLASSWVVKIYEYLASNQYDTIFPACTIAEDLLSGVTSACYGFEDAAAASLSLASSDFSLFANISAVSLSPTVRRSFNQAGHALQSR